MRYSSRLLVLGLLALVLFLAPGLARTAMAQAPVLEKRVIYGFNREFPPFSYEHEGEPTGFEVELLRAVLAETGSTIVFKPMNWEEVQLDLSAGNVHVTSGMVKTRQRILLYDFPAEPNHHLKVKIYMRADQRVQNLAGLRGKRVAVQRGSLYQRLAQDLGGLNIQLFDSHVDGVRALAAGEVDAFCGADKTTDHYLRRLGYLNLSPVGTPLADIEVFFAVNKDQKALMTDITNGLRRVHASGLYDALFRKWFVRELSKEERDNLIEEARQAMVNAYAPYSGRPAGAAILGRSGIVYRGAAVENALPALTADALTVAVQHAVAAGETDFRAVVTVDENGQVTFPTASDRQLLYEFGRATLVVTEPEPGMLKEYTIPELLPHPAEPKRNILEY